MGKNTGKWAGAAVAAGLIGYAAGVLTAPKSGKETRKDIKNAANQARAEAEKKLKEILADLNLRLEEAKEKGAQLTGKAHEDYEKILAAAIIAKDKVREVLSAIHDGDADDPELKQALKDAKDALKNLEKFANKSKASEKDYQELGKAVAQFYETGYLSKQASIKMSFLKGMAGGFGGVLGATIVIALLLWFLSFFDQVPLINKVINTIDSQGQYEKP